jgi:putative tryptophan/tyrosine transport system substrate-binding protein
MSAQDEIPSNGLHRIGFLNLRPIAELQAATDALKNGLRDTGRIGGKDYLLYVRSADNDPSRYGALTAELAALGVKVIVAASTPAAVAIHKHDPAMRIVVRGPDIVGAGLAESATRPGGVVTGIEELTPGVSDMRLRLLKEAVPTISRVAVLSSAPTDGGHAIAYAEIEPTAKALGLTLQPFRISATTDFDAVFAEIKQSGANAIFCLGGVLPRPVQKRIVDQAGQRGIPAVYPHITYLELGGLMSYAYSNDDMFYAAATLVDKILKGANPGDLPLTVWTKYYLTLNTKAASALGVTWPPSLLAKADKVVK